MYSTTHLHYESIHTARTKNTKTKITNKTKTTNNNKKIKNENHDKEKCLLEAYRYYKHN